MVLGFENVVGVSTSLGIQLLVLSTILEYLLLPLWVCADTASLASPAYPGSRKITSKTLVAKMRCRVNTTKDLYCITTTMRHLPLEFLVQFLIVLGGISP